MSFLAHNSGFGASWIAAACGSSVVHGAVLLAAVGLWNHSGDWGQNRKPSTDFNITFEQLDTDALVGLKTESGVVGVDPEGEPDPTGQDPATQLPTETDPQVTNVPEVAPTENPVGNTDPITENPITTPPQPPAEDPKTLPPVIFQGAAPTAAPDLGGASGTATRSPHSDQLAMALPAITPPEPPPIDGQPTAPTPPQRVPTQQDIDLSALIERIQAMPAPSCLVALPRRDGEQGAGLALIGSDGPKMREYASQLLADWPDEIRQTQVLIDPRQCPALTYASNNSAYPASRLGIRLDSAEVPSGGRLSGIVRGVGGKSVLMLVIDANGVVQSLERFTTINGNFARFEVPVTRTGPQRDTAQILLILATSTPAEIIEQRLGQEARDVFAGLEGRPISDAAMAITTFDVR